MNLKDLSKHFKPEDIEWRLQQCGEKNGNIWAMCLAYITNRAIMDRLDEVVGPDKWKNEFAPGPHGGVICGLSIKIGDEWVTKWDGAENTDIEAVKGGLSGAMKRAAVQWGMGRYLYDLEEGFAEVNDKGLYRGKTKEGKYFKWNPPKLPAWALPEGGQAGSTPAPSANLPADGSSKGRPEGFESSNILPPNQLVVPLVGLRTNPAPSTNGNLITEQQKKMIFAKCQTKGINIEHLKTLFGVKHIPELKKDQMKAVMDYIDNPV